MTASGPQPAAGPPIRVLVADPAPMQRSGLRMVLTAAGPDGTGPPPAAEIRPPAAEIVVVAETGTVEVSGSAMPAGVDGETLPPAMKVAETGDGAEAVELARRLLPDVLITEIALPRLDGLAVARAVAGAGLPVRTLFLSAHDGDEHVLGAIAARAGGFLRKDALPGEVVAAVRAVAAGGAVITPAVLARVLGRVAETLPGPETTTTSPFDALTGREREVLIQVARGHSNAEIATALQVRETTIKTHVGHVLTKLRLRDRTQAVVLAYETGLVKPGF